MLKTRQKEDFEKLAEKDPYIGSAYQQLQIFLLLTAASRLKQLLLH